MQNFHFFAEAAMSLIHRRHSAQEADRLRDWLRQAAYGLNQDNPRKPML
jgi:hypothetical protein